MEWTPCSKKVPDKSGYYLATVKDIEKDSVWIIYFYRPTKTWYKKDRGSACYDEGKYKSTEVLAWAPVPKPYDNHGDIVKKIDELLLEIENTTIDAMKKDGMITMGKLIKWIVADMNKEEKYKAYDDREVTQ